MRRQVWGVVVMLAAAVDATAAERPEPVRSIAEILALPPADLQANRAAVVRGTVTICNAVCVVIEDEGLAIYLLPQTPAALEVSPDGPGLEPGCLVEVAGHVVAGGYAPTLVPDRIRVVGRGPVPAPMAADLDRLFRGGDTGRRVSVAGVVQAVVDQSPRAWGLVLDAGARHLLVGVPKAAVPEPPDSLVDAAVSVTGVVGTVRNSRHEFVAPGLLMGSLDDVEQTTPAPADPFAGEVTPLGSLARFQLRTRTGHRVRTVGTVSYAGADLLFLEEAGVGIRVNLAARPAPPPEPLAAGDRVEVAGFVDMRRSIAGLTGGVVRRISTGRPPQPTPLSMAEIARQAERFRDAGTPIEPGSHDGRLVRCTGLIEAVAATPGRTTVTLAGPGGGWFAIFEPPLAPAAAARLSVGSEVAVAGILQLDLDAPRVGGLLLDNPLPQRITVLARDAADLTVIRAAPWWNARRLAILLAAATAALAVALAGAAVLGRRVRRQAAALAATMQAQREAAVAFEAALRERNRLAANLHDTVLQTVTGIGYQLQACEAGATRAGSEAAVASPLGVAQRMVLHAVDQLRGAVWALHAMPQAAGESFVACLEARIAELHAGPDTPIRVAVVGRDRPLAEPVATSLTLVAQEAIRNALRHAAARAIEVEVAYGDDGRVAVTVRDDGRGFQVGRQPGTQEGHFGVEVMIDRMQSAGGECTIESRPGQGTTVRAVAPAAAASADLPDRSGCESSSHGSMPS